MTLFSVLNTLLPATGLVAAAWIAMPLLRLNAATRYAAWWVVLTAVLAMPLMPRWIESAMAGESAIVSLPVAAQPAPLSGVVVEEIALATPRDWESIALAAYLSTAAILLLRLLVDFWRVRRLLAASVPLEMTCGESRGMRLLASPRIETPLAAGFLKPAILFPAALAAELSEDELRHIVAHEAAHISRFDHWMNLVGKIVQAVCWPHPLVAIILNRIEVEREHACDDWVVAATGQPASYARSLMRLVELVLDSRAKPPILATSVIGKGPRVSKRVETLLDKTRNFAPRISVLKLAMSLVCLGVFIAICTQAPTLVAMAENPPAADAREADRQPPPAAKSGFLAALAEAGYKDLSVDEIIEMKNRGVDAKYIREMADNGWGRLAPKDLINLRSHGVSAEYLRDLRAAGIKGLTLDRTMELRNQGVSPKSVAQIHALGFGPYNESEIVEMSAHGLRPDFFRILKENGIPQISARDAMEAASHGLSGRSIVEARKYGPNLSLEQILKLKRAGVI